MTSRRRRLRRAAGRIDRRLLRAATGRRSPGTDRAMIELSTLADRGLLWLGVAGALTATRRRRARSAAVSGVLGLSLASTLANGPLKFALRRARPHAALPAGAEPLLALPATFSFPSGHAASAAAFATGVGLVLPAATPVVGPLAAGVAYSRVHTGVHYPSDVIVGAAFGVACGALAAAVVTRMRDQSLHRADVAPLPEPVPRRAVLVANRSAGAAHGLAQARHALAGVGARAGFEVVEELPVQQVERVAQWVREATEPLLIVAAGGDGTVGAVANQIAGTSAVLGIVPLGTSNDTARSLGIPPDPVDAVQTIVDGQVRAVDLGLMTDGDGHRRHYVNAATTGLNAAFADLATTQGMRRRFGRFTYPVAAASALRHFRAFRAEVAVGLRSQAFEVVHLSVSNATVFGGVLGFRTPGADMTDGRLDLIVVEPLSLTRLGIAVLDAVAGRHAPVRRVHASRVVAVEVTAADGATQEITLDGEVSGHLPARFECVPGGLRVVTP